AESAKAMVGCPLSAAGDGVLALFGAVGSVIIQPTEGLAAIIDDDYKTEQFTRGYASVLYDMGSDLTHTACFKHLERLSAGADQAERSESTGELVADPLSGLVLGQGAQ
ncbi:MAG TPA: hypothetical protein VL588_10540, partial [Bdellovibrionota bacterium]|nr:hypothetical protein [Bdellovibrionota bacterium]